MAAIHEHDLRLANRFRDGLGLEESDSAIVFVDSPGAEERLERAGIRAAMRNGRLRTSWHVYNTDEDVERRWRHWPACLACRARGERRNPASD